MLAQSAWSLAGANAPHQAARRQGKQQDASLVFILLFCLFVCFKEKHTYFPDASLAPPAPHQTAPPRAGQRDASLCLFILVVLFIYLCVSLNRKTNNTKTTRTQKLIVVCHDASMAPPDPHKAAPPRAGQRDASMWLFRVFRLFICLCVSLKWKAKKKSTHTTHIN